MNLIINTPSSSNIYPISSLEELENKLLELENVDMAEVWLNSGNEPTIAMFTNDKRAFLMYLPKLGSAGFTSRANSSEEINYELVPIYMKDSQGDEKPSNWFISLNTGLEALKYFFSNKEKLVSISWYDDSKK